MGDCAQKQLLCCGCHKRPWNTIAGAACANYRRRTCRNPDWRRLEGVRVRQSRSEEHTSELQSQSNLVCRLLLEKKKKNTIQTIQTIIPAKSTTLMHINTQLT